MNNISTMISRIESENDPGEEHYVLLARVLTLA
jgi:hypothetical protein